MFPFVWGETVTFAWLITKGWVPHQNYWDQHTQGLPLLGSLLIPSFGPVGAFRLIWLTTFTATLIVLYLLCAKYLSQKTAYLAASIFTLWHIFWAKNTIWFHDPILFTNTLVLCFLLMDIPLAAGIAAGMSILFKQQAFFFLPLYATWLVFTKEKSRRLRSAACFLAGSLAPLLLMTVYFLRSGSLDKLIDQTIFEAAQLQAFNITYNWFFIAPPRVSTFSQLSLFLILLPFAYILYKEREKRKQYLLLSLSLAGTTAFLFPQITLTYAQLSTPVLAVMTAAVLSRLTDGKHSVLVKGLGLELIFLIALLTLLPQLPRVTNISSRQASQTNVNTQIIAWIKQNTAPSENIFVCCGKPDLYVLMDRVPASHYVFFSEIYNPFAIDPKLVQELTAKQPRIIVYSPTYFDIAKYDPVIYGEDYAAKKKAASFFLPQFEQYLSSNYHIVYSVSGTVNIWERIKA